MSEVKDGTSAAGHVRDARAIQWVTSALSLCNTGENVLFIVDQSLSCWARISRYLPKESKPILEKDGYMIL